MVFISILMRGKSYTYLQVSEIITVHLKIILVWVSGSSRIFSMDLQIGLCNWLLNIKWSVQKKIHIQALLNGLSRFHSYIYMLWWLILFVNSICNKLKHKHLNSLWEIFDLIFWGGKTHPKSESDILMKAYRKRKFRVLSACPQFL